MEFCSRCGMRMILQLKTKEQGFTEFVCPKCGYSKKIKAEEITAQKKNIHPIQETITVIGDETNIRTMPITKIECPKCGNKEAYWWIVQTRGADESPTQFFRCTKCKYTWREMA